MGWRLFWRALVVTAVWVASVVVAAELARSGSAWIVGVAGLGVLAALVWYDLDLEDYRFRRFAWPRDRERVIRFLTIGAGAACGYLAVAILWAVYAST